MTTYSSNFRIQHKLDIIWWTYMKTIEYEYEMMVKWNNQAGSIPENIRPKTSRWVQIKKWKNEKIQGQGIPQSQGPAPGPNTPEPMGMIQGQGQGRHGLKQRFGWKCNYFPIKLLCAVPQNVSVSQPLSRVGPLNGLWHWTHNWSYI